MNFELVIEGSFFVSKIAFLLMERKKTELKILKVIILGQPGN